MSEKKIKKEVSEENKGLTLEQLKEIFPDLIGIIGGITFVQGEDGTDDEKHNEIFKRTFFMLDCEMCQETTTHVFIDLDEQAFYGVKCSDCLSVNWIMRIDDFVNRYIKNTDDDLKVYPLVLDF